MVTTNWLTWRRVGVVAAAALLIPLNVMGIAYLVDSPQFGVAPDFQQYAAAVDRFVAGQAIYDPAGLYRYSPLAIPVLAPMTALGLQLWTVLHGGALLLLRPWWLPCAIAMSWPFWADVVSGNTMTFVLVAAILAVRGSKTGELTFFFLTLLMPRIVQLPLVVWLVWKRPQLRLPYLTIFVAHAAAVLATGAAGEWWEYLIHRGLEDTSASFNVAPGAPLGTAWVLIGAPLAAGLVWRGWVGLAGLVAGPYLLAQYLLMFFVDISRAVNISGDREREADPDASAGPS